LSAEVYSFATAVMRYVFIAAIYYILFRIVYHSVNEYNELQRVKNWIEKGYAKHIEFLPPFDNNEEGFILVKSNLIGRSRRCDICIEDKSVKRRHARIYEKYGDVFIETIGRAEMEINGEFQEERRALLADGDLIQLGSVRFYYKLKRVPFEGEDTDEQG